VTIAVNQLTVRHERRIRVLFTAPVAAGAFVPGLYSLTSAAGAGDPPVVGAILLPGAPIAVELALGADLQEGGSYVLTAVGVPGLDGSVTPEGSALAFRWSSGSPRQNVEQPEDDLDALLYGIDLVWTGTDFGETPLGDLATVQGVPNAQGAVERRLAAEEDLPWREGPYGPHARAYVDGPQKNATTLRGAILRQARVDNRVKDATASFTFDTEGDAYFDVEIDLVGADSFSVNVPVTSSGGGG
jgi:hypothetical protein